MIRLAFLATTSILAITLNVRAQEKKIDHSALPPAVQKTVEEQSKGATIKGFSTEREHGKILYEAETVVNGTSRNLQIAENGTLTEVEQEVDLAKLPEKVQAALRAKAGEAKIIQVESLTKHDKLVAYEAATVKDTKKGEIKKGEIQVGPDGGTLLHEE